MAQSARQAESVTFGGASGAKYSFEVHRWGTTFAAVGAVYGVLRWDAGSYRLIYVGETSDLSSRFDNHHRAPCFDRHHKSHLAVMAQGNADRRRAIEADIRQHYNPPCNLQ